MDKKYNGFNNGRDRSDGVGGREVNHGKQETMTKEQECVIQKFKIAELIWDFNPHGRAKKVETILIEIDILIDKQLSAERERAGKLVEALKMCRRPEIAEVGCEGMRYECWEQLTR